jgi:hypothetical protein
MLWLLLYYLYLSLSEVLKMELEKVDIQEVFHKVAEGTILEMPLQVAVTTPRRISWIESQVNRLEFLSGDIQRFSETQKLFEVEQALSLSENAEFLKRWNKAIVINKKIRMRLITSKALRLLEDYQNLSPTSSAGDISYARTVLSMCNADKEKEADRAATEEEDAYEQVERNMERE